MSMESSKRKSPFRSKLFLLVPVLFILLLGLPNLILNVYKPRIIRWLDSRWSCAVTIKNIYYLPPNLIIIRGFDISGDITMPVSYAFFSLPQALNGRLFFRSLRCFGATIALKADSVRILTLLGKLPKQNLDFSVNNCTVRLDSKYAPRLAVKLDSRLKIDGDVISASGLIEKTPYKFRGRLTSRSLYIEEFKLQDSIINCELWGWAGASAAELKGFLLFSKTGLPLPGLGELFIVNIDSRINYIWPYFGIERLDCIVNNNPVNLRLKMRATKPQSAQMQLSLNLASLRAKEKNAPGHIGLKAVVNSCENDDALSVNGKLVIDSLPEKNGLFAPQRIALEVENLIIAPALFPSSNITSSKVGFLYKTPSDLHVLNLKDFFAGITLQNKNQKISEFSALFYNGLLKGQVLAAFGTQYPRVNILADISGADAFLLKEIMPIFSKVHGTLSAQASVINYPDQAVMGNMNISDGYLENFDFFVWLSDLFDLPSLKKIPYRKTRADFIINRDSVELRNIYLDSDNVRLKGDFKLSRHWEVKSKISLDVSRQLLKESPSFARLLKLLRKETDFLTFNFQFSGHFNSMNFQWLESDFKEQIQKAIPGFIKRQMEKEITDIIDSISRVPQAR